MSGFGAEHELTPRANSKSAQARSISIENSVGCAPLGRKKHVFLVMSAPVVDHVKRSTIQEIASKSPFNVFNIVAIVAIAVIGYFLYRKFNQKFAKGAIKLPVIPTQAKASKAAAPVVEIATAADPDEVADEPDDKKDA